MRGIVFLDRDGTLIEEAGYLGDPAELRLLPGAAEALRRLVSEGYRIAVISNQAGLARGKFTAAEMEAVHREFIAAFLREGVTFDAVEYCPHHPEGVVESYRETCDCRKPGTGMADRVLRRLGIPDSCPRWVVGDKMTDILMGVRLGARTILVETGYGNRERTEGERLGIAPGAFLPGMAEAADRILSVDGASPAHRGPPQAGHAGGEGKGRAMDRELLEILACPKCKGELQLSVDETELRCEACRVSYRVEDGIPILLIDEASPHE